MFWLEQKSKSNAAADEISKEEISSEAVKDFCVLCLAILSRIFGRRCPGLG